MNVQEKIESLRRYMAKAGLQAYIITGSDPHDSEYPPARWRSRGWISGFTGSAGTVVISSDKAGLWTDFRYWIQAGEELDGSGIELFRDGDEGVPGIKEWLGNNLKKGAKVAVDGRTVSSSTANEWSDYLRDRQLEFISDSDLLTDTWKDRPESVLAPIVELDEEEAGESRSSRLDRLKNALEGSGADTWLGIGLDSIAWLLNIRGADVPYNPVVLGFVIYTSTGVTWFTDQDRLSADLMTALRDDGVQTAPYEVFFETLGKLPPKSRILIDHGNTTPAVIDRLPSDALLIGGNDPVVAMKAVKSRGEISRINRAMEKDGVAVVRFLKELEDKISGGEKLSEVEAADMLRGQRSSIPGFLDESFSSIPAVGAHGAIIHYEASPESASFLEAGSELFLIDSGGQWEEGTTDITRTITLGSPTDQQIQDYTLTLKGHIALSRARFPRGTRGYQLDTLARIQLWKKGIDYGHGTGHGVGYRLNVHEGPQKISTAPIDVALEPGMVISNEPGIYRQGVHGLRIENLLVCREDISTEFARFLAFDTLTLAPYDNRLIDSNLLDEEEKHWVNEYHKTVLGRLGPLLENEGRAWLEERTRAL